MPASTFWLSHSPPVPIFATFAQTAKILTVTFDRRLTTAVLDGTNWDARVLGVHLSGPLGPGMTAAGSVVTGRLTGFLPDPGPDVCSFSPPPFDVLSDKGLPAAAFVNYPLVLLP